MVCMSRFSQFTTLEKIAADAADTSLRTAMISKCTLASNGQNEKHKFLISFLLSLSAHRAMFHPGSHVTTTEHLLYKRPFPHWCMAQDSFSPIQRMVAQRNDDDKNKNAWFIWWFVPFRFGDHFLPRRARCNATLTDCGDCLHDLHFIRPMRCRTMHWRTKKTNKWSKCDWEMSGGKNSRKIKKRCQVNIRHMRVFSAAANIDWHRVSTLRSSCVHTTAVACLVHTAWRYLLQIYKMSMRSRTQRQTERQRREAERADKPNNSQLLMQLA